MRVAHGAAFDRQFVGADGEVDDAAVSAWCRYVSDLVRESGASLDVQAELVRCAHLVAPVNAAGVLTFLRLVRERIASEAMSAEVIGRGSGRPADWQVLHAIRALESHALGVAPMFDVERAAVILRDCEDEQFVRCVGGRLLHFTLEGVRAEWRAVWEDKARAAAVRFGVDPNLSPVERAMALVRSPKFKGIGTSSSGPNLAYLNVLLDAVELGLLFRPGHEQPTEAEIAAAYRATGRTRPAPADEPAV
jgi:hypothetical protein